MVRLVITYQQETASFATVGITELKNIDQYKQYFMPKGWYEINSAGVICNQA